MSNKRGNQTVQTESLSLLFNSKLESKEDLAKLYKAVRVKLFVK